MLNQISTYQSQNFRDKIGKLFTNVVFILTQNLTYALLGAKV